MKFTIVITTYNRLSLLKRAIDTSLAQTVPCEVIVADDCSSDETEAYVKSLREQLLQQGDNRLIYHRNSTNSGHSATMNAGVQVATGDWIKPVDDDDYLAPNCIQEMLRAIALRQEAVICSCQAAQVDVNQVKLAITRQTGPGKAFYIPQEDIHYGMLLELVPFGTPIQVAFRRDAFLKSGGWDSSLDSNFDDIDSWLRIAQFGDAVFINQCLAYRTHWQGAYNKNFALDKRLNTNILIKQKIYPLVSQNYRPHIPQIRHIQDYLRLHWSLAALKQGKIFQACQIGFSVLFLPVAWSLLLTRVYLDYYNRVLYSEHKPNTNNLFVERNSAGLDVTSQPNIANVRECQTSLNLLCILATLKQGQIALGIEIASLYIYLLLKEKLLFRASLATNINQQYIDTNFLAMERIYSLVSQKQNVIANIQEKHTYIKLRWSFLSLKEGKIFSAIKIALPAIFSPLAWQVLAKFALLKQANKKHSLVRRIVLIDR